MKYPLCDTDNCEYVLNVDGKNNVLRDLVYGFHFNNAIGRLYHYFGSKFMY